MRSPGIGVRAFVRAVERVTGVVWTPQRLDFGGRTDPDIALGSWSRAGLDDLSLVPAVLEELAVAYESMADELRSTAVVMPGVGATLTISTAVEPCRRWSPATSDRLRTPRSRPPDWTRTSEWTSAHTEAITTTVPNWLHSRSGDSWRPGTTCSERRSWSSATRHEISRPPVRTMCVVFSLPPVRTASMSLRALDADLVLADLSEPDALTGVLEF